MSASRVTISLSMRRDTMGLLWEMSVSVRLRPLTATVNEPRCRSRGRAAPAGGEFIAAIAVEIGHRDVDRPRGIQQFVIAETPLTAIFQPRSEDTCLNSSHRT